MEKNSKFKSFFSELEHCVKGGSIPPKYAHILEKFYQGYQQAISSHQGAEDSHLKIFFNLLESIKQQCIEPFVFQPYHEHIRKPFDYYQFGLDLILPLVDLPHSSVAGLEHLKNIVSSLEKGKMRSF